MRRVRYVVAASLDGYIAGPNGEADWIPMDPEFDFAGLFNQFDTFLIGRRTFAAMPSTGQESTPGVKTIVFSKTLRPEDHPAVTIVADGHREVVEKLKAESGKDIWLFGGGELFRSLAAGGLVDTVEVAIIPILLGGGIPLLPAPSNRIALSLVAQKSYASGVVTVEYTVGKA